MSDDSSGNGTREGVVSDAVREIEKELRAQGVRKWLRRVGIVVVIVAGFVGLSIYQQATAPPPKPRFETRKLETRDIREDVQSTGSVKPLKEVEVGAQVSGRVVEVLADFNTQVKKGDLLAQIDPSLFGAQVSQTSGQLRAAQASHARAKASLRTNFANLARLRLLRKEGLATDQQVEQAEGSVDVSKADVAAAKAQISQLRAQLSSARTTLAYAKIYSPIDGVVVNRAVDPGQTVAASFSAPVLFVIAQDLRRMQVLADIDEADVGKLKEDMKAEVVVDAFPGEKFEGEVTQVRYAPNNVQGVVTYSAVVDVKNPDLKLRPGMTATVTIKTKEALRVLAVPNAALRFKPLPEKDDEGKPKKGPELKPLEHGQGRLYFIAGGAVGSETLRHETVRVGVTDGIWTELVGSGLEVGADVVVEERDANKKKGFSLF